MKTPQELETEALEKQKSVYQTKADMAFMKKPDPKDGKGAASGPSSNPNQVPQKKVDQTASDKKVEPVVQDPKKNAAMFNMFGDNAPKK